MKKGLIIVIILLVGVIAYMYFHEKSVVSVENDTDSEVILDDESDETINDRSLFDGEEEKKINEENEFLIVKMSYPAFADSEIGRDVESFVEAELRQFKKDISFDNFPLEEKNRIEQMGYKYTFDSNYKLYEGRGVSTVFLDFSTYTGGAHGGHYLKSMNYNDDGQRITIGDMFMSETNYLTKLSETSRVKIKEKLEDGVGAWADEGTAPTTDNFSTFYTDMEGILHIVFQPYQVAPWAAGVVEISIDMKSELGDIIDPKYLN
jgi:hypothetical protein